MKWAGLIKQIEPDRKKRQKKKKQQKNRPSQLIKPQQRTNYARPRNEKDTRRMHITSVERFTAVSVVWLGSTPFSLHPVRSKYSVRANEADLINLGRYLVYLGLAEQHW